MPNAWTDLPNGPLLSELLELATSRKESPDNDFRGHWNPAWATTFTAILGTVIDISQEG